MTNKSSSSSRSMISSVKPAASRSKLGACAQVFERHHDDLRAVRAVGRDVRRGLLRDRPTQLQREYSGRDDERERCGDPHGTRTEPGCALACRRRARLRCGGLGFAAGIDRFDRIAPARQLDLHAFRGPFARVVLGESLPQPQRFDAHERIGLRVEIGRAAEHADGDRITLEPLALRRRASC